MLTIKTQPFGIALGTSLAIQTALCWLVVLILPGWSLPHGWLALLSSAPIGSLTNGLVGIVVSFILGWLTAVILALVYNRLVKTGV